MLNVTGILRQNYNHVYGFYYASEITAPDHKQKIANMPLTLDQAKSEYDVSRVTFLSVRAASLMHQLPVILQLSLASGRSRAVGPTLTLRLRWGLLVERYICIVRRNLQIIGEQFRYTNSELFMRVITRIARLSPLRICV